jgi:hypothetical protein
MERMAKGDTKKVLKKGKTASLEAAVPPDFETEPVTGAETIFKNKTK